MQAIRSILVVMDPQHPEGLALKRAKLIAGVTQLLVDTLGKNPATTVVVIDEVDTDNWGIGGHSVTDLRKSS